MTFRIEKKQQEICYLQYDKNYQYPMAITHGVLN